MKLCKIIVKRSGESLTAFDYCVNLEKGGDCVTKGYVNSFQSLGTVDGPGVRYVVFMQGCPLRCKCCHNPDTWEFGIGAQYTPQEILEKVKRCRTYFGQSGGITVSGGEPLMQAEFVYELFELCHQNGINTALDTSGCVMNDDVMKLLNVTDTVLLDFKMTDENEYKSFTGMEMKKAEEFLKELDGRGINTWLRQVIVCDINDNVENVRKLFDKQKEYKCISKIELLPFRKLCITKYDDMGIEFPLKDYDETPQGRIDDLLKSIINSHK